MRNTFKEFGDTCPQCGGQLVTDSDNPMQSKCQSCGHTA